MASLQREFKHLDLLMRCGFFRAFRTHRPQLRIRRGTAFANGVTGRIFRRRGVAVHRCLRMLHMFAYAKTRLVAVQAAFHDRFYDLHGSCLLVSLGVITAQL